ncbi:MAG: glycosyltransferase family 9 protein [Chloroherpetonaceae bacterium]|nr:glycosyltransferase family 9 protein [Chloroherpetonaceae bacterium]
MPLKSLERYLRNWLVRSGNRLPVYVRVPVPLFAPNSRILLLRHDKLGDAIISLPLLRVLRTHFPEMQIDVLLSKHNFALAPHVRRYANQCWQYEKSALKSLWLVRQLRAARYHAVVDLMDNASATSSVLIKLLDVSAVGIEKSNAASYTYLVPMLDRNCTHIVERLAQLLLPFGIDPNQESLELEYPLSPHLLEHARQRLGEKLARYRFGINISAGDRWRYWGKDNFIRFISAFKAQHSEIEVVVFAHHLDRQEAEQIAAATNSRLAPIVPTLDEFAAMLVQCDALLSPDTAIVHIAAAWKVPQVVLYSRAEGLPMVWLPYRAPHRALETRADSIQAIGVEAVLKATESLWQEQMQSVYG